MYYADATVDNARHVPRHYFRLFNRFKIADGANILDFACGTSEWLDACARHNCQAVKERWKDLHVISVGWIKKGKIYIWRIRAIQVLLLAIWPLRWQYQVYHRCVVKT